MPENALPYLLDPEVLINHLNENSLRIVCLGKREQYLAAHIPGAVYLDVRMLNRGTKPAPGLLPEITIIEQTFQKIGLTDSTHVVSYDDDAGTAAARLIWVLEAMGHRRQSFLDGGLNSWKALGLPLQSGAESIMMTDWKARPDAAVIADKQYVAESLGNPAIQILDARSPEEHLGIKFALHRRGKIPGSVNLNWLDTIDTTNHQRLKSIEKLEQMLRDRGFDRRNEIITHCQTHQRSSHSFMMLRALGFEKVRGYAGSWSEWAEDPLLPVE